MKRYKINLKKQLSLCGRKDLYFSVFVGRDRRVMKGQRNVLVISPFIGNAKSSLSESELGRYKVNVNGSVEIPKSLIKMITHGSKDTMIYSMISAIDDKTKKILVPWLDDKGDF
jgi:hypothetical protein